MGKFNKEIRRINEIIQRTSLNELEPQMHNKIRYDYDGKRVIMSNESEINYRPTPNDAQEVRFKPKGLWYGIGYDWINFVTSNMPEWEKDHVFELILDESKLIHIKNFDDMKDFDKKYGVEYYFGYSKRTKIDWAKVAEDYEGIEISPYVYEGRRIFEWYYGWDVESGCIWGENIVIDIKKITL